MATTYVIGPFFAQRAQLTDKAPLVQTAITREINYPYRVGKSLVIRLRSGNALILGIWTDRYEEDEEEAALMAAIEGRIDDEMFDEDGKLAERFADELLRQRVGRRARNVDDEWRILNELNLLGDK